MFHSRLSEYIGFDSWLYWLRLIVRTLLIVLLVRLLQLELNWSTPLDSLQEYEFNYDDES